ncbi:ATP-binding response regulator [Singulisphaera acidiphila]|uniref:histidine kinase n=1 Tax=Singulisphaera acidiphila (strain ATCC BAA-1392 / DSM 18658 / VKM B-2454 / MOB10) TaxID=886293 RepID=L0DD43_SINAD|nr:ATP-binding protein [Singulisphaera acidiphila]AGA27167.1 signal transduction histidine kinase [Singulisphaera acidiphila DSM 18658]
MSAVLIVDDSPADRALFRILLSRAGHTVHEVARGGDALVKAREVRPHAIVLDVNLPDMDGHSVCRAIRADPEVAGVPVLMLTVRDNDNDVLTGLNAGADDYVTKDSPGEIFLARISRLIQYRQMATVAALNENLVQVGRLLAGIVHEIRGPLSVIRGSAELMKYQLKPDDPYLQWLDPILRNAQVLQVRLEHLMATVRSGPPMVVLVDLPPLVRESADLFLKGSDPRGSQVGIETIVPNRVPPVRADAGRLLQVFLNLLGNAYEAILASGEGGQITVRVEPVCDQGVEWVRVEICDNGPGIPEALLGRIFEPFFTTKETGSGYGLYLASEILKEQGGRLTASNLPGGGACFAVWLPQASLPASIRSGQGDS